MIRQARPVDVISVCSVCGEIRPLRLRVENEEQQLIRVNIDQVLSVKEIPYVGAEARIFLCRGTTEGRQWTFELKYSIRSHCWCLLGKEGGAVKREYRAGNPRENAI